MGRIVTDVESSITIETSQIGQIELVSLVLVDCSIERQGGELGESMAVSVDLDVQHFQEDDETLAYLIAARYELGCSGATNEPIALISMRYLANYEVPAGAGFSEDKLEAFGESVVLQVTPFHREFLASVTNRMGLPTFYLPLMRYSVVRATRAEAAQG